MELLLLHSLVRIYCCSYSRWFIFLFLGIREFAISPLLVYTLPWPQYARRRHELGIKSSSEPYSAPAPPTWTDLRQYKTLDTGLSGALAGGLLRGWKCTCAYMLLSIYLTATPGSRPPRGLTRSINDWCYLHRSPDGVQRSRHIQT